MIGNILSFIKKIIKKLKMGKNNKEHIVLYIEGQNISVPAIDGTFVAVDMFGVTREKFSVKNGKVHGRKIEYFKDGTICAIGHYVAGKKDGIACTFHRNGVKSIEVDFTDNKEWGVFSEWNKEGILIYQCSYYNGEREGLEKTWDSDGFLSSVCIFVEGKRFGEGVTVIGGYILKPSYWNDYIMN